MVLSRRLCSAQHHPASFFTPLPVRSLVPSADEANNCWIGEGRCAGQGSAHSFGPRCGSACRSQALLIYCSIVMDYVPQCFVCDSFNVLHSQRKQQKDLLAALQKVVVPIYCTSFLAVEEEKQQKITRVNTGTYFPSLTHYLVFLCYSSFSYEYSFISVY